MDEETVMEVASLLKRRKSQREYLADALRSREKAEGTVQVHVEEINRIQLTLRLLGYTGQ